MSHSSGEVITNGEVIGWFEYNGTSDITIPMFYDTQEEMSANWRSDNWRECICDKLGMKDERPVTLYAHYGGGFHWQSKACFHCKTITGADAYDDFANNHFNGDPLGRQQN